MRCSSSTSKIRLLTRMVSLADEQNVRTEPHSRRTRPPAPWDKADFRIRSGCLQAPHPGCPCCRSRLARGSSTWPPVGLEYESEKTDAETSYVADVIGEGAICGATEAELNRLIDLWPLLPLTVRHRIMAMIEEYA